MSIQIDSFDYMAFLLGIMETGCFIWSWDIILLKVFAKVNKKEIQ
jgi:hypothetical protein